VEGYEVIYYGRGVEIAYPQNLHDINKKRPEGRSFHHGRFIGKLREAAKATPNITVIESTVTDIIRSGYNGQVLGVQSMTDHTPDYVSVIIFSLVQCVNLTNPCQYFGHLTVISDGYSSKFRGPYHTSQPTTRSKFWGLELVDCPLPSPNHGHVVLGDGAPVLLYQIGTHETRALIDIPSDTSTASTAAGGVKSHLRNTVLPTLPPAVQPSFAAALDKGKLRSMPNSFLPPATNRTPGLVLLGDAMNMRHPLTGGGMTVAFNDVVLLSSLLSPETVPSLSNTSLVLHQLRAFHWRRKNLSSVINILAQALYALFAASDPQLRALQQGCFEYFQCGGNCIDGPVGLLGGIIRRPLVLIWHFFAVALYSIWILFRNASVWRWPRQSIEGGRVFVKACLVLFPYIFAEVRW
jgi:squalene monooxygenase